MKAREKWFAPPVVGGLVVLLAGVVSWVVVHAPAALTPIEVIMRITTHESLNYFYLGKAMAEKKLEMPAVRWSHYIADHDTSCDELVDGYWEARGWVQVREGEQIRTYPWVACFRPGSDLPLFVGAGRQSSGDFQQVLNLEARSRSELPNDLPVVK